MSPPRLYISTASTAADVTQRGPPLEGSTIMAVRQVKFCKLRVILSKKLSTNDYSTKLSSPKTFLTLHRTSSSVIPINITKTVRNGSDCLGKQRHSQSGVHRQTKNFSTTNENRRKGEYHNSGDDDDDDPAKDLGLMSFPEIKWPSIFKTIKNQILAKFIISMYFDQDFNLDEFATGARKAFLVVSQLLRSGDFDGLVGLVTTEAIEEMRRKFRLLRPSQMLWFTLQEEDIYFSFPYQIGIMIDDVNGVQKRHVEITYCYHCLLGLEEIRKEGPTDIYKYKDRIFVANCRFIKEFTKGVESDWTMNVINVFKPATK